MDNEQRLFTYSIWRDNRYFLATSKREIIETLRWYHEVRDAFEHIPIPTEHDIRGHESIRWELCGAMGLPNHFVKVEVYPGLRVEVNANAFDAFRRRIHQCLREPESKRGTMYKFGGVEIEYTIGQDILDALAAYDWDKHTFQIDQWLGERHKRLDDAGVVPIERWIPTEPKGDSALDGCRKILSSIADTFVKYWNKFYRIN